MSTPSSKPSRHPSEVSTSSEELSPEQKQNQILEKLSFPDNIRSNLVQTYQKVGCNILIARHISAMDYHAIQRLNRNCSAKSFLLLDGDLFIQEAYETPQSKVHAAGVGYFNFVFGLFRGAFSNSYPELETFRMIAETAEGNNNNQACPDFTLFNSLVAMNNAVIIGEFCYSSGLSDGHVRAQLYLTSSEARGVIVVCVRYPWSPTADRTRYDDTDGAMVFLFYDRDGEESEDGDILPTFVSSFGQSSLTLTEQNRISEIVGINAGDIHGVKEGSQLVCNRDSANHADFNFQVPSEILFMQNVNDEFTITNELLNEVHVQLSFNLFDLQTDICVGLRRMNREIYLNNDVHVVRERPRFF